MWRSRRARFTLVLVGVALALIGVAGAARACSTPVNRYALYRWERYPYRVFYAYRGTPDAADQAFNEKAIELTENPKATSNFEYIAVNLDDSQQVDELPPALGEALQSSGQVPGHFVVAPTGALVASGRLGAEELDALVDSPARKRLAELMGSGKDGVLILVKGKDEKENANALKEVQEAIRRAGGKDSGDRAKEDSGDRAKEDSGDRAKEDSATGVEIEQIGLGEALVGGVGADTLDVGHIVVSPDDAREKWLLRFLRSVERLEPEDEGRPMVFAAYGRGRVMPPYIGAGIVADNLLDVISFVNGPCSCQVKDQNPGVDLLTSFDWDATASKIAREVGQETGNEHLVDGTFFEWDINEITLGGEESLEPDPETASGGGAGPADADASDADADVDADRVANEVSDAPDSGPEDAAPSGEQPDERAVSAPEAGGKGAGASSAGETGRAHAGTRTRFLVIGLGVAAGVIALAVLSLALFLRRGA